MLSRRANLKDKHRAQLEARKAKEAQKEEAVEIKRKGRNK